MEKPLNIIFLGLSGSGKGTQVGLLKEKLEDYWPMQIIVTGDFFRDLAKQDTDVGRRIKKIQEEGGWPFDDLATTGWMYKIAYTVKENEGILCDGFPRRVPEAQNLDRFLTYLERIERTRVIYLTTSEEAVQKRMLARGRADDTEQAIMGRISYFRERVLPVIDYYKAEGRLMKIDGEQDVKKVHADIVKALGI